MVELVYKNKSYLIMGCCFEAYNDLGFGHREKTYKKAILEKLRSKKIDYKSELYVPIKIDGKLIDKHFIDILVDDIIAIELKVGDHFYQREIDQLYSYLKSKKLKLGLLVNFTSRGVKYKRILNL